MAILQRQIVRFRAVPDGSAAEALLLAARQNPVLTQTITRPYTTITALVTLGPGATTSTAAQRTIFDSSTTALASSTSAAEVAVPGAPSASSSTLTHAQLGAILGSVLGSVLLIILIWYCVTQRRRENEAGHVRYVLEDDTETSSETVEVRMAGGGGGGRGTRRWMAGGVGDPWIRATPAMSVVPPPARFPPTPRYTPYRQTRNPQIRGVRRYP